MSSSDSVRVECVLADDPSLFGLRHAFNLRVNAVYKTIPGGSGFQPTTKMWRFPWRLYGTVTAALSKLPEVQLVKFPPAVLAQFSTALPGASGAKAAGAGAGVSASRPLTGAAASSTLATSAGADGSGRHAPAAALLSAPSVPPESLIPPALWDRLMAFQRTGVQYMVKHRGRALLADEMGLGKTIQALACAVYFRSSWPLLVIAPRAVLSSWRSEVLRWVPGLGEEDVCTPKTGSSQLTGVVRIISYDMVATLVTKLIIKPSTHGFVIADESHLLKTHTARRTKCILPLLKGAAHALCLSGTPALSRPAELHTQISALAPSTFGSYKDFTKRYCEGHMNRFGAWEARGSSHADELKQLLEKTIMIRRFKRDVLSSLPPKKRFVVNVPITPAAAAKKLKDAVAAIRQMDQALKQASSLEARAEIELRRRAALSQLYRDSGVAKVACIGPFLESFLCPPISEEGCPTFAAGAVGAGTGAGTAAAGRGGRERKKLYASSSSDSDIDDVASGNSDSGSESEASESEVESEPSPRKKRRASAGGRATGAGVGVRGGAAGAFAGGKRSRVVRVVVDSGSDSDAGFGVAGTGKAGAGTTGKAAKAKTTFAGRRVAAGRKKTAASVDDALDVDDEGEEYVPSVCGSCGAAVMPGLDTCEKCDEASFAASFLSAAPKDDGGCVDLTECDAVSVPLSAVVAGAGAVSGSGAGVSSVQVHKVDGSALIRGGAPLPSGMHQANKIVVFGHHRDVLDGVEAWVRSKGYQSIRIDGKTNTRQQQQYVLRFQTDPQCQVAIVGITSAGTGITLTSASACVFAELYWNPGTLNQAEDRIHRIGQTADHVQMVYLVGSEGIDEDIWSMVGRKIDVLNSLQAAKSGFTTSVGVSGAVPKPPPSTMSSSGGGARRGAGAHSSNPNTSAHSGSFGSFGSGSSRTGLGGAGSSSGIDVGAGVGAGAGACTTQSLLSFAAGPRPATLGLPTATDLHTFAQPPSPPPPSVSPGAGASASSSLAHARIGGGGVAGVAGVASAPRKPAPHVVFTVDDDDDDVFNSACALALEAFEKR